METESLLDEVGSSPFPYEAVEHLDSRGARGPVHICSTGTPSSLGGGSRRMGLTPAGFLTLVRDTRRSASASEMFWDAEGTKSWDFSFSVSIKSMKGALKNPDTSWTMTRNLDQIWGSKADLRVGGDGHGHHQHVVSFPEESPQASVVSSHI